MPLIDIEELSDSFPILKNSLGNYLGRALTNLPSFKGIESLYSRNSGMRGPDFAGSVLKDCGIKYEIAGLDNLKELQSPFITISNHPYGGLDGILLVDILGHLFPGYKIIVNKTLGRIETLSENFIPVTPTGKNRTAPTGDSIKGIRKALEHLRSGQPLGIFPAGAVSDLHILKKEIIDRQWQASVIRLIKKAGVPVVPIRFLDGNSAFFYALGLIDWRLRTLRLPGELFNKKGKRVRIRIGEVIRVQTQKNFNDIEVFSAFLRTSVYGMPFP